jgi:hypothetical protein
MGAASAMSCHFDLAIIHVMRQESTPLPIETEAPAKAGVVKRVRKAS